MVAFASAVSRLVRMDSSRTTCAAWPLALARSLDWAISVMPDTTAKTTHAATDRTPSTLSRDGLSAR